MNDWNYTKKGGKLGLIYGLTYSLYLISGSFLTPLMITDVPGTGYEYNFLLDLILLLPVIPVVILPHLGIFILFEFPLAGVITGAVLGFIVDLIRGNLETGTEKSQREKGVFIRIPLGNNKKIVISEKMVNCFIIAEFLILIFIFALNFSGGIYENSDANYEEQMEGVDGKYLKGGSDDYTIFFNKSATTFIESYPDGSTKNGTYLANETFLILYYSDGKTAEYFVNNSNLLRPADRSQFSSEMEWKYNSYSKPMLM